MCFVCIRAVFVQSTFNNSYLFLPFGFFFTIAFIPVTSTQENYKSLFVGIYFLRKYFKCKSNAYFAGLCFSFVFIILAKRNFPFRFFFLSICFIGKCDGKAITFKWFLFLIFNEKFSHFVWVESFFRMNTHDCCLLPIPMHRKSIHFAFFFFFYFLSLALCSAFILVFLFFANT